MSPFYRRFYRCPVLPDGSSKTSQSPVRASRASLTFTVIAGSICFLTLLYSSTPCWAQTVSDLRRPLDAAIIDAQSLESPLLAPKAYGEAKRLYEAADAALRRDVPPAGARAEVERAITAAQRAGRAAVEVRALFPEALSERAEILQIDPAIAATADRLLAQAATHAEAGDRPAASRFIEQMIADLARAGAAALRENKLAATRRTLEQERNAAPGDAITEAFRELDAASTALADKQLRVTDVIAIDKRLDGIIAKLFPAFYRNPPMTLTIDGFTLFVENYEARSWDFRNTAIIGANGTAWLSFHCGPSILHPFPPASTITKTFRVVESVRDATSEISAESARRLAPHGATSETLDLRVPKSATTGFEIAQAIEDLIAFELKPKGDIRVHFENFTIVPGAVPGTGIVLNGQATYPTTPLAAQPRLQVAGFTLELEHLVVRPIGATVTADLEFPVSIVDPGTGQPGRIPLGDFAITPDCKFHRELPSQAFGPWAVGNTEMLIQGKGVIADFDTAWVSPSVVPPSAAAQPIWRGAILGSGDTIPATERIISNCGYLRARYTFASAEVTALGLLGEFMLAAAFTFYTLEPFDYEMRVSKGHVTLRESAVESGRFDDDRVAAPSAAVRDDTGRRIAATYTRLDLDAQLNLRGSMTVSSRVRWGDFVTSAGPASYYEVRDIGFSTFFIAGQYRPNYFPLDAAGEFVEPGAFGTGAIITRGMQGLTLFFPVYFTVLTPDTPAAKPIEFGYGLAANERDPNWINVSYNGVHGRLNKMLAIGGTTNTDLGQTGDPLYEGNAPFHQSSTPIDTPITMAGGFLKLPHYRILMRFVSSATFESDMRGMLRIPNPVDSDLEFSEMVFTSTARNAGGKVPLPNPMKLSYWGLDMVKKPGATSAGVLSVRTGKVLFTAAGIHEPRHFQQPFYLVWGEMRADGGLQRLVFDYNSAGQRFDRFLFTPTFVRLSDYVPTAEAFLKVAGTVHFDFFGAKYINLQDAYVPATPSDPFNSRRVTLSSDVDPAGAFAATDTQIARNWSDNLGSMSFTYEYDFAAQDGFRGTGLMDFLWVAGQMQASIALKAEQICMSVNDTNRHDFSLGPVAHLGAMSRITGCACLEGGQLQRATLSSELEGQEDANVALRAATYGRIEWMLTPNVTSVEVAGDMYLTILVGGNIQVTGRALFTMDRALDFVAGEVDGRFDTGTALGLSSVSANGQLNWHIGTLGGDAYQSIQGKLAVHLVSVVAGTSSEGGFYVGLNAPKAEAWVLATGGDKFKLNMAPLPARLTGVYGYGKASTSINVWVFSGGMEVYAALGGLTLSPAQVVDLGATSTLSAVGLPFVVGNFGVHIWGEILGGLVGAGGWGNFNVIAPYPFSYQGTIGLEGCVAWVVCGNVDVTAGLNSEDGLFVE